MIRGIRRGVCWTAIVLTATVAACQTRAVTPVADLSDVTAVLVAGAGGGDDVHLVDAGGDPSDANLVMPGVSVGGVFDRVRDGEVTRYESFDLAYQGGALFGYRTDGDWTVAESSGRRVTDIVSGPAEPQVIDTADGVFVVFAPAGDTCLVYRLDGPRATRLGTADQCGVDARSEKVVAVDVQSDGDDVSMIDLASGRETHLERVGSGVPLTVEVAGDRAGVTVDGETATLYDLADGTPLAEVEGSVVAISGDSAIVRRFDPDRATFDWSVVNPDRELARGKGGAGFSPSGAHIGFHIDDGSSSHVSLMDVATGEVTDVGDLAGTVTISWIDDRRALVVSSEGDILVAGVDGAVHRLAALGIPGAGGTPVVDDVSGSQFVDIDWLGEDSYGATLAVLNPAAELIQVHDLSSADLWTGTEGYIVIAGVVGPEFETSLLVSVEISTGRVIELDFAPGFETVQIDGDRVYYTVRTEEGVLEVRRSPLDGSGRPQSVYSGATMLVPGPAPTGPADVAIRPVFRRG